MFFTSLMLAISSSIDAFGIGTAFGIKNTKVPLASNCIIFILILLISSFGVLIGSFFTKFLSPSLANFLGSIVLILMGFWIIYHSTGNLSFNKKSYSSKSFKRKFFIKPLRHYYTNY